MLPLAEVDLRLSLRWRFGMLLASVMVIAIAFASPASAAWPIEESCAARAPHKVFRDIHCMDGPYQYLTRPNRFEYIGAKGGIEFAGKTAKLWIRPEGGSWRLHATKTFSEWGRAKARWVAPSFEDVWRFQWRSPAGQARSPKIWIISIVPSDCAEPECDY